MRTFAAVICFATFVVLIQADSSEEKNKVKNIHHECQSDPATHADEDLLKKFHRGEEVDKAAIGPHILCMSTKFGIIDADGKINKSQLEKGLSRVIKDENKLKEAKERCGKDKATPQETALAIDKCFSDYIGGDDHHNHH